MGRLYIISGFVMAFVLFSSTGISGEWNMKGRSSLELQFGMWTGWNTSASVSGTGIRTDTKSSGPGGMVAYSQWLEENVAILLAVAGYSIDNSTVVGVTGTEVRSSSVGNLLLGVRFYVPDPSPAAAVRPFFTASVGPCFGHEAKSTLLSAESHSESAFGGHVGIGADFLLGQRIKLGIGTGYHMMTDFAVPVGAKKNYSGADFMMGFGYLFTI